ncbi:MULTISPECIES: YqaE/Pmp3 family membrane protein [Bacillaceae]|uniref:YqaE/Pmp3 family membrane protein n=1 Tax=Bacillaceae TaxID=186817 RepID=UPI001C87F031|nr:MULTISPECIES: YqaE/Pmp3 family membrane protein [Bacillaceae]
MRYLLAVLLPPLAVFLHGSKSQTLINVILTIIAWIPGAVHALLVVNKGSAESIA